MGKLIWMLGCILIICGELFMLLPLIESVKDVIFIFNNLWMVLWMGFTLVGGFMCCLSHNHLKENYRHLWQFSKENDDLSMRRYASLDFIGSALATYIENNITEDILCRNDRYCEEEKKHFAPMRIDRNGDAIIISARKKYGEIKDRSTHILEISTDVFEINCFAYGLKLIPLGEEATRYEIIELDVMIADLKKWIRDCRLPIPDN